MRNILWNNKAKLDYFENIDFLLEKWSKKKKHRNLLIKFIMLNIF